MEQGNARVRHIQTGRQVSMPMDIVYGPPSLFDRLMSREDDAAFAAPDAGAGCFPPVQICEDERTVHVRALLPGAPLEHLSLTLENGCLILRGILPAPTGRPHRRERPGGPFRREIRLPAPVGAEPAEASLRDGVLTVALPKTAREGKRAIRVHSGSGAGETP